MALGALAGAVLGGIAGGQGNRSSTNSSATSTVNMLDINQLNRGRSGLEALGDNSSMDQLNQLLSLVQAGPGVSAITDATTASNNYANMLQGLMSSGGAPGAGQISAAQNYAAQIFAPQQTALNQQFDDQRVQAQRLAARLGRPGNDPILANKLAQEQTRQQSMLNSQQGAFGAQYADQLLGRQLDLGNSLMNVRNGLATQAFNNRQTLLGLGQQLVNSERNYRMNTATRTNNTNQTQQSGGGLAGTIGGAFAGFGAGAGAQQGLSDIGSSLMSGAQSIGNWFSKPPPATPGLGGSNGAGAGLFMRGM